MSRPFRMLLFVGLVTVALLVTVPAGANHAGCFATTATPACSYTAIGAHQAIPVVDSSWEITVVREGVTVVLASGSGGEGDAGLHDVAASPGELVTVSIKSDGPGGLPVGFITSGNTAGHLPV